MGSEEINVMKSEVTRIYIAEKKYRPDSLLRYGRNLVLTFRRLH
jgi:hypothetical protein